MSGPTILVLGSTGLVGGHVARALKGARVRVSSRDPGRVQVMREAGHDAVLLDLDDPSTFPAALYGVDRLYLVTGYTVAMLAQSKTIVDASVKAGVRHIVHQGVFNAPDCTDPHLVWHQLIECYIEASGIAWTHLHPNVFMEQIPAFMRVTGDTFPVFWGDRRPGWVAAEDVGSVAARVLVDGPDRHAGRNYWLSTEVAGGNELATIFSKVANRRIRCDMRQPQDFVARPGSEPMYAAAAQEFLVQLVDGRMGYIGTVRNDAPFITGNPSMTIVQWAMKNSRSFID
jgi:NAD(P)H dehydrogenase (quinone)